MNAMRKFSGAGSPGKRSKPDGAPDKRRAGKGPATGKSTFGGARGYKSKDSSEGSAPSGERPYKSRKPFGQSEGSDSSRPYRGSSDEKPARPWKRDEESGAPREKRFSDSKPTGDRPFKSRSPIGGHGDETKRTRPSRGGRDEKPAGPWKRDDESGAPRERKFSDSKPSGDRPYKSRRPAEGEGTDSPRPYRGSRDEKSEKPWKRDDESAAPRERKFSENKPSEDRPYKSRRPAEGEGTDSPRPYRGSRDEKPERPWKRDNESGASRERKFSDSKPSGDRPYKSRRPAEGEGADSPRPYRGSRDEKSERPWKRDGESAAPRERRFSDSKPSGDRPYKSRRPDEGQGEGSYTPRPYKGSNDEKPERPWKSKEEKRKAGTDGDKAGKTSESRPRIKPVSTEYKPKRPYKDSDETEKTPGRYKKEEGSFGARKPGSSQRDKSGDSAKPKAASTFSEDGTIRLNKFIANSGICSRREADSLIESGVVSINGKIVTELGTKITRSDKVQFAGETLNIEKKVYLLLNKPKGYITTVDDPQERNTVMMLIKDACHERVYPVGRLDRNTSGLLLFTNDGEMAKKLTHPGHKVRKVYHVELNKALSKGDMLTLTEGIELEDGLMAVDEIAYTGTDNDKKHVGIVIHSGKNRVVRRLFESLEYEVVKLDRVAFANLTKKDLPRGRWRFLDQNELNLLMMI